MPSLEIEVAYTLLASVWLEDIQNLLPEVVRNLETDELTEKAERNLTQMMQNDSEQRGWLLRLRDEMAPVCQERDPITLQRIPELLRCTIQTETGHVFCYNVVSLLTLMMQPFRLAARGRNGSLARFLDPQSHRVLNPLTNIPLTKTEVFEIVTKANQLVILLRQLSR